MKLLLLAWFFEIKRATNALLFLLAVFGPLYVRVSFFRTLQCLISFEVREGTLIYSYGRMVNTLILRYCGRLRLERMIDGPLKSLKNSFHSNSAVCFRYLLLGHFVPASVTVTNVLRISSRITNFIRTGGCASIRF